MSAFENARIYAWYKLRRKTRKYRNRRVLRLFDAAVAKLQPGDVCFDCGANVGVITSRLAATGVSVGSTLIGSKKNVTSAETVLVDVIDLGTMIADFPQRISLLKIDIEGAEVDVMNSLLDRGVDAKVSEIFVETHEKQIPELRGATMKLLKRCRPYPNLHLDWW